MTHYGDMANRAHMGEMALTDTIRQDDECPLPGPGGTGTRVMMVRVSRDGLGWLGRVWDEVEQVWYWIPLPFSYLASYADVEEEMLSRGIISIYSVD